MIPIYKNPRFWVPIISNTFLISLLSVFNTQLSPWNLYLFIPGVFPLFLAFNRPGASGLGGCILSGFLLDALFPVPMGLFATLFAAVHATSLVFAKRLHRENIVQFVSIAFILNLVCWGAVTLFTASSTVWNAQFFAQFFVNLFISQIVITPVAWWYFEFQAACLRLAFGIRIFEEDLT